MADLTPDSAAPAAPPTTESTPSAAVTPAPAPTSSAPKSIADETAAAFRAAREKMAPAESSPAEPDSTSPAGAARVPGVAGEAEPPARGPIPFDRHQAVLTRARNEARAEAEREFRAKLGWAERFNPQEAEQGTALVRWLQADPKGAIDFLTRQLPAAGAAAAPATPAMPEPNVVLGDGSKFYDADGMLKVLEWRDQQLEARMNGRYGPMLQKAAHAELMAQANMEATQHLQYYRTNFKHFRELEKDIKQLCEKDDSLSIDRAYSILVNQKGFELERKAWESERAGHLARKAAASSIHPGVAQPATPRPNSAKSTKEIATEVWNRAKAVAG